MQCPYCGKDYDRVVDSRSSEGGAAVRRRRVCLACSRRFTTYERAEETLRMTVIKKDGSREPYDRAKVVDGLERACFKRPVSAQQIARIVETAVLTSKMNGSTWVRIRQSNAPSYPTIPRERSPTIDARGLFSVA